MNVEEPSSFSWTEKTENKCSGFWSLDIAAGQQQQQQQQRRRSKRHALT